jgi:hypothetical protein
MLRVKVAEEVKNGGVRIDDILTQLPTARQMESR